MSSLRRPILCLAAVVLIVLVGRVAVAGTYSGGDGSAGDPYVIKEAGDLVELSGTESDWGECFVMSGDIDIAGIPGTAGAFVPIGGQITQFSGRFDGAGFCMRGFTLAGDYFQGVFGWTAASAQIMNIGIESGVVAASGSSGMLVGYNSGSINNCYGTGIISTNGGGLVGGLVGANMQSGTLSNSYSTVGIFATQSNLSLINCVGGLVGENMGQIDNCYASGSVLVAVFGETDYIADVGGLAGTNGGTINNCYATGDVSTRHAMSSETIGGFVGTNGGTIGDCYSMGYMTISGAAVFVGGFVGRNFGTIEATSFWNVDTSGMTSSGGGTGIDSATMRTQSTFTDAPGSWDFGGVWQMEDGVSFPYLHIGIGAPAPFAADLDHDGDVDLVDFAIMAEEWLAGT